MYVYVKASLSRSKLTITNTYYCLLWVVLCLRFVDSSDARTVVLFVCLYVVSAKISSKLISYQMKNWTKTSLS